MDHAVQRLAHALLLGRRHEQQKEPAAAGADQLAADRARGARRVVERVDLGVRDGGAQAALGQPRFVEKLAELPDVPVAADDRDALVHQIAHDPELAPPVVDAGDEGRGDARGGALDAGVEQHQMGGELPDPVGADGDRCHRDLAVLVELDVIQAAVGRQHLIL